jgi:DNA transformation protein
VVANSQAFVDHVLDLLNASVPSTARKMFGGHGVYCDGLMYGLIDDDAFFLKADDECRQTFVDAGCRQWFYGGGPNGPMPGGYYEPPAAAIDDPDEMRPWAVIGLAAARRKKAAKEAKGAKPRRPVSKVTGRTGKGRSPRKATGTKPAAPKPRKKKTTRRGR